MRSNLNFPQASVSDVRLNLNFTQTRLGFARFRFKFCLQTGYLFQFFLRCWKIAPVLKKILKYCIRG